jgi:hypothetical protein
MVWAGWIRRFARGGGVALLAAAAGCWTVPKQAVLATDTSIDLSRKSVVLFSIHVEHGLKPWPPPVPHGIFIDRQYFPIRRDAREPFGPFTPESLVRIAIEPGPHTLRSISGHGCGDLGGWGIGTFSVPLAIDIDLPPAAIVYLGRIDAHTRERRGGEFTAGPNQWLNGQGICGWLDTTWEVEVLDAYETDLERFRAAFPALRGVPVVRRVMTFDRAHAQSWWEANR